jgi:hypothetical protein
MGPMGRLLKDLHRARQGSEMFLLAGVMFIISMIMSTDLESAWWRVDTVSSSAMTTLAFSPQTFKYCASTSSCSSYAYTSSNAKSSFRDSVAVAAYFDRIFSLGVAILVLVVVATVCCFIGLTLHLLASRALVPRIAASGMAVLGLLSCLLACIRVIMFDKGFVTDVYCGSVVASSATFGTCISKSLSGVSTSVGSTVRSEWGTGGGHDMTVAVAIFSGIGFAFSMLALVATFISQERDGHSSSKVIVVGSDGVLKRA